MYGFYQDDICKIGTNDLYTKREEGRLISWTFHHYWPVSHEPSESK